MPDLIGASSQGGSPARLALYVNDSANGGTYKYSSSIAGGFTTLFAIQSLDVNNDGSPDLILNTADVNYQQVIIVLLADAVHPGGFLSPVSYPDKSTKTCLADLNSDGLPD